MPFVDGIDQYTSGSPGRMSGRLTALRVLDQMLNQEGNRRKLREALQRRFDSNPVRFFKEFVIPLLPRTTNMVFTESSGMTNLAPNHVVCDMDRLMTGSVVHRVRLETGEV